MVLIISQDIGDDTTDRVIDWLDYFGQGFFRVNGIDFHSSAKIVITNSETKIECGEVDWTKVSVIWFRRWLSHSNGQTLLPKLSTKGSQIDPLKLQISEHLRSEGRALTSFFFEWISSNFLIFGSIHREELNKLFALHTARRFGFNIPVTRLINNAKDFDSFRKTGRLITKAIANGATIHIGDDFFLGYTTSCDTLPSVLQEDFHLSLFQHQVEKEFEVRSVYIDEKVYSMAIFSQSDEQTRVDFRRYNDKNPNRVVPFKLPMDIESKIIRLSKHYRLEVCSLDLIKTKSGDYVFLEINPYGQFGMVSFPCNYYLEKKVAEKLKSYVEKNRSVS